MIANSAGIARRIRFEFQIWPVEICDLTHLVERKHTVDGKDTVVGNAQRALHKAPQLDRHARLDVEPDHRTASPPLQCGLEQSHQIFGLFQDFDFRIAVTRNAPSPFTE